MYANIDGKWMSWNHRSIMEWSSFLNFAPYSPFSGTGSLFLPNLPWLNPGALALALPGPIEYKHLLSYFVYLTELTLSMYFLFLELKLERAYAFTAVLLYVAFFFVPFNSVSGAPSWYSLAPFFAHQAAAMNLATVALLRAGQSTLLRNVVWGLVFIACLFIAFSSAPTFNLIYVPVYAVFWTILAFSSELDRRALPFRIGLVLCTAAVFSIIGLPGYLSVTAAVSARDSNLPAFLHPGMALLTVDYRRGLISRFSTCSGDQALFLICVSRSPVAWVQIAALLAGAVMIVFDSGRRRALAITVVTMIFLLHFYYLMTIDNVLGPAHIVGYTYLYWTLYPLLFAVAVAGIATIVRRGLPDGASVVRWIPAVANTGISIVLLMIFIEVIAVRQPRVAGEGALGFRQIAHIGVRKGPIHRYLEEHAALAPGKEFRGYVGLYLGAPVDDDLSSTAARLHQCVPRVPARPHTGGFFRDGAVDQLFVFSRVAASTEHQRILHLTSRHQATAAHLWPFQDEAQGHCLQRACHIAVGMAHPQQSHVDGLCGATFRSRRRRASSNGSRCHSAAVRAAMSGS
jgi:hypothetical protein